MRPVIVSTLLAVATASPAAAQELGGHVVAELGTSTNTSVAYETFSETDAMPSKGLRGGVTLGENFAVMGGWHRVRRGARVEIDAVDGTRQDMVAAFFADQFTVGPKVGFPLFKDHLYPYAEADALLFRGVMKLDDDPSTRRNLGQVRGSGLSVGFLVLGGVELRAPIESAGIAPTLHLEMGYGLASRGSYGELGSMNPGGGFALRSGLGLRF